MTKSVECCPFWITSVSDVFLLPSGGAAMGNEIIIFHVKLFKLLWITIYLTSTHRARLPHLTLFLQYVMGIWYFTIELTIELGANRKINHSTGSQWWGRSSGKHDVITGNHPILLHDCGKVAPILWRHTIRTFLLHSSHQNFSPQSHQLIQSAFLGIHQNVHPQRRPSTDRPGRTRPAQDDFS